MNREKLYDLIYAKADKLFKQYNPCNIRMEQPDLFAKDKILMCKKYQYENQQNGLCCKRCRYLRSNGCAVKCVGCKTGFCVSSVYMGEALEYFDDCAKQLDVNPLMKKQLRKLHKLAYKYDFIQDGRNSKRYILSGII